jgi:hypothetical protein
MAGTLGLLNFREIHFNSRYRSGGSIEQPIFNIYQTQKIKQIQVLEAEIPFTWHTIDSTNNKIDFFEPASGGTVTVTIPPGNYSIDDYILKLQLALTAISPNGYIYTVSVDKNAYRLTITSTGIFNILWLTGPNNGSNMHELIGFSNLADQVGSTSYTGTTSYNMAPDAIVFIKCNQIRGFDSEISHVNPTIDSSVLARIPINVNTGDIIQYTAFTSNPTSVFFNSTTPLPLLSFFITRENNVPINLNGIQWTMKLGIFS